MNPRQIFSLNKYQYSGTNKISYNKLRKNIKQKNFLKNKKIDR